jgi:hypothetical protein
LSRRVVVSLLSAAALAAAVAVQALCRYCWPSPEGHRRPILLGLWQPGPRDRADVQARFEENLRRLAPGQGRPQWGPPVLGNPPQRDSPDYLPVPNLYLPSRYVASPPAPWHCYCVWVPYSAGGRDYVITAEAENADVKRSIRVWVHARYLNVLAGTLLAFGYRYSRGEPLVLERHFYIEPGEWPVIRKAAEQVEEALRAALE